MITKEMNNETNEKQSIFSRNKGFFLLIFLLFITYQSSSWFIDHWFAKREIRDSNQILKQELAEAENLELVKLELSLPVARDENIGNPEMSLSQIFNKTSQTFYKTQEFPSESLKELEDFIEFKLYHKHNPLLDLDMKKFNEYLVQLLNLYAIEAVNQHPEIRDKNIDKLKSLFVFHKNVSKRVYKMDDKEYEKVFPINDSFINAQREAISNAFLNEYKLKNDLSGYLLRVGGDELKNQYFLISESQDMPYFVSRNTRTLNRYINNLNQKVKQQ